MGNAFPTPSLFLPSLLIPSLLSVFSHFSPLNWVSSASLYLSLPIFHPAPSLSLPPSLPLLLSALLWVGGSLLYLIGVSLYRRRDALTGSESGGAHLPHVPRRTTCVFFFFFLRVFSWEDYFLLTTWRKRGRKIGKGERRGAEKHKERERLIPQQVKENSRCFSRYVVFVFSVWVCKRNLWGEEKRVGSSLCYCITEVWGKLSIPLACQSLPLACHMDWYPNVDSV